MFLLAFSLANKILFKQVPISTLTKKKMHKTYFVLYQQSDNCNSFTSKSESSEVGSLELMPIAP